MAYTIVTDSACNLPAQLVREYDIRVIPLKLIVGREPMILDSELADDDEALRGWNQRLREGVDVRTSPANEAACEAVFEKILAHGEDLLYIGFSSRLSDVYATAKAVLSRLEKKYPERRICLFDSRAVSFGEGLLVMKAAEMQEKGATLTEVFDQLKDDRNCLHQYFTVPNLKTLARSGRLKGRVRLAGSFGRQPLLSVDEDGGIHAKASARSDKGIIDAIVNRMSHKIA